MKLKALILYYSCSNNTQIVAKETERILKDMNWEISLCKLGSYTKSKKYFDPDLIILGVPVHYWEIPDAAVEMIHNLSRFTDTAGFVFSTFGKCVCNSVPYNLAKALQAKGVTILGGAQILMPHSARMNENVRIGDVEETFGKGEPTEENQLKYKAVVHDLAKRVGGGNIVELDIDKLKKLHTRNHFAEIMNKFMTTEMRRSSMPFVQYTKDKCIQCKKCINKCDYGAISITDDKEFILNKERCKKCYKCIEECNEKALYTKWNQVIFWTRFIHSFSKNTETIFVI